MNINWFHLFNDEIIMYFAWYLTSCGIFSTGLLQPSVHSAELVFRSIHTLWQPSCHIWKKLNRRVHLVGTQYPRCCFMSTNGWRWSFFICFEGRTPIQTNCGPNNIHDTAHIGIIMSSSEKDCQIWGADEWLSWEAQCMLLLMTQTMDCFALLMQ